MVQQRKIPNNAVFITTPLYQYSSKDIIPASYLNLHLNLIDNLHLATNYIHLTSNPLLQANQHVTHYGAIPIKPFQITHVYRDYTLSC